MTAARIRSAVLLWLMIGAASCQPYRSPEDRCRAMCAPRAVHALTAFGACECADYIIDGGTR